MKSFSISSVIAFASVFHLGASTLLVDFSAARGDNPSVLGNLNLEKARDDKPSANSADLYIKLDKDPQGVPALHCHRKTGYIRSEYHTLKDQTEEDTTYYIGYTFSLGTISDNLVLFQWKEYKEVVSQNIPLDLEFNGDFLQFNYQAPGGKRVMKWEQQLQTSVTYRIGIVVNTSKSHGFVQLYWNGARATFNDNGKSTQTLEGIFFSGQADPKFGAYRGEAVGIDTYIYRVQIGTALDDVKEAAGIGSTVTPPPATSAVVPSNPTQTQAPACSWAGHCVGASCESENDCSDDLVCSKGHCARQ